MQVVVVNRAGVVSWFLHARYFSKAQEHEMPFGYGGYCHCLYPRRRQENPPTARLGRLLQPSTSCFHFSRQSELGDAWSSRWRADRQGLSRACVSRKTSAPPSSNLHA